MAKKSTRRGVSSNSRNRRPPTGDPYDDWSTPADRPRSGKSGKKSKKKRRKAPLWAKFMVTVGALLTLMSGVAVAGVNSILGNLTSNIQTVNSIGDAGEDASEGNQLQGAINILLLGLDWRPSWERDNARADTVILLHIPKTHDQAYLMSIPRDTMADIPANSDTRYGGGRDKINAAFYFGAQNGGGWGGGLGLTARTVSNLTGIKFNGAAVIDFGGFRKVIDALGTVRMCVESEAKSLHYYYVDGKPKYVNEHEAARRGLRAYVHKKGCRDLKGWEALDFSRIRKSLSDGDYGRQRHQQQLIKAIAKKATSTGVLTDVGKVNELTKAIGKSLFLDTNKVPLVDFLFTMKDLAGADMVLLKTNAGWYNGDGSGGEALSPDTMAMFRAAKSGTMGQFLLENPDFVNNEE